MDALPYFAVYNEKGKLVSNDKGAGRQYVLDLLARAEAKKKK